MTWADLVPIFALLSVVDFIALVVATAGNWWIDVLDVLFAYVFTFIAALTTIILSAKYGMLTYTWLGAGVVLALMA